MDNKKYAYVSCRVLKEYGDALAELSAAEDLKLATFVTYELSRIAAERKGLAMPEKPSEKDKVPPRQDVEKAAKARGMSLEEYMAAALREAVKRDAGGNEASVRKAPGTYAKSLTPAKLNRQLRESGMPPAREGTGT